MLEEKLCSPFLLSETCKSFLFCRVDLSSLNCDGWRLKIFWEQIFQSEISPIVAFLSPVRRGFFAGGEGWRVRNEDNIFSLNSWLSPKFQCFWYLALKKMFWTFNSVWTFVVRPEVAYSSQLFLPCCTQQILSGDVYNQCHGRIEYQMCKFIVMFLFIFLIKDVVDK